MAHFAELDENNIVTQVLVIADEDTADEDGNEVEAIGIEFCQNLFGGTWIQTSYNDNLRRRFAGIGWTYDPDRDAFITSPPFPSWSLDENHDWQPPADKPYPEGFGEEDSRWYWNDAEEDWVEAPPPEPWEEEEEEEVEAPLSEEE